MASINERENKDGTTSWQVHIRDKTLPKPIVKTFPTHTQAEEFAFTIHRKLKSSPPKPINLPDAERQKRLLDQKLVDLLANFAASPEAKQNHLNILPTLVKNIGNIKVGQIRRSWVKNFIRHMREQISQLGRPYADATIAALIWTANAAVKWHADELDLPHPDLSLTVKGHDGEWDNKRERRLEDGEEAAIMARLETLDGANRDQWIALFQLAIETAARQDELLSAKWSEFDLAKRVWLIPRKITKSKKTRAVPLTEKALDALTRMKGEEMADNPRVFPLLEIVSVCPTANSISTCFGRYVRQAGVEDFRFHDLRHEAASRMAIYWREFTIFEIMLIVGHKRIEMFQRYANLRADELVMRLPKGGDQGPTSSVAPMWSKPKISLPFDDSHPLAEFAMPTAQRQAPKTIKKPKTATAVKAAKAAEDSNQMSFIDSLIVNHRDEAGTLVYQG